MKRTVSAVLLLAVLAGLISCGKEPDQPVDTAPDFQSTVTGAPVSETEDEPEKGPSVAELLTKVDFDGATVNIVMDSAAADYPPPEDISGSAINDALVDRNRAVEELYNVDLEFSMPQGMEPREQYVMWAESGDDTYKLYTSRSRYVAEYIVYDVARSWSKYPDIIDFDADWFDSYAIETFAIGDDARLLYGDANESGIRFAWIWLFNKELAEDYHLPDLYEMADEGKWTLDRLLELTQDVYTDANGNGKKDEDDVYGYVSDNAASFDSWGPTLGVSAIRKDENNIPYVIDAVSETTIQGFEKLYNLFWESKGTYVCDGGEGMFVQKNAVFHNMQIKGLENDEVREMVDFGVLPTPKLSEEQDTYYTHTDCCFSCMLLPSVISEEEALRSVYIANAMNAFSHEIVLPVYYEMVLKTRLTRDRESPRMMDLALDGRRYGFEYFGETWFPITHVNILRKIYSAQKCPSASTYASKLDNCQKKVKDFLADWEDMVYWENKS